MSDTTAKKPKPGDALWLSRHALTKGILPVVAESVKDHHIKVQGRSTLYEWNVDVHPDWESAASAAQESLRSKVKALEKQLMGLRKVNFMKP